MQNIYRRFTAKTDRLLRQISVKARLLGIFFIVTFLPLAIISVSSYKASSNTNLKTLQTYSASAVGQLSTSLNRTLTFLEDTTVKVSYLSSVQQAFHEYADITVQDQQDILNDLQTTITSEFILMNDIKNVSFYVERTNQFVCAYKDFEPSRIYLQKNLEHIAKKIDRSGGRTVYTSFTVKEDTGTGTAKQNYIILCRPVYDILSKEKLGYIYTTFKESQISSEYKLINSISGSKTFLLDSAEQKVLSGIGTQIETAQQLNEPQLINRLINDGYYEHETFFYNYLGEDYLVAFSAIANTDLFLISMVPKSYIFASNRSLLQGFVIAGLGAFILAFSLAMIAAHSVVRPVWALIEKMRNLEKQTPDELYYDNAKDEIAELNNQFIKMVHAVDDAAEQRRAAQEDLHKMHLTALQAQINPHFLVNTLNTVKWLATYQNAGNIEELTGCLINLLYETIGKGDELIELENELSCLEDYATIQSYRYLDRIKLFIQADENVKKYKVPRFLIQPLVENSILHGFSDADTAGAINVTAKLFEDKYIKISVTDNGCGMTKEKIQEILLPTKESKTKGLTSFGVFNVNERIKLYYGDEYGLMVTSEPFIYTSFEMLLPIQQKKYKLKEDNNVQRNGS